MVESTGLQQLIDSMPAMPPHTGCGSCGSGSAAAGAARCGNGLEKVYPTTAVRFGYMRYIGEFSHPAEMKFACGAKVVIQTKRGIELGEQVSLTCNGCDKSVSRDQMKAWVKTSGEDSYMFNAGRILREATAADHSEWSHIQQTCGEKRKFAQATADQHKLKISIVDCEYTFGGERIIYFFTAAERVDFRAMVKELAREYRTRIEMRQVGARDEARLLADFETCGREVCCKVFLKTLKPISMRMAKLQKATLDPTQVSGRCGRLKCCLRYEHMGYEELDKLIPRVGKSIRTQHGDGVVVNRQILTQLVQIRLESNEIATVVVEDILKEGETRRPPPQAEKMADPIPESKDRPPPSRSRGERKRRPATSPRKPDGSPRKPGGAESRSKPSTPRADGDKPKGSETPKAESSDAPPGKRRRSRRRRRRKPGSGGDNSGPPPSPPKNG